MKRQTAIILAFSFLLISTLLIHTDILFSDSAVKHVKKEFPDRISNWNSTDVPYDNVVIDVISPDQVIYKTFLKRGKPPITLFMACYFSHQKADLSHSPVVCFSGQGWTIKQKKKVQIPLDFPDTSSITVNLLVQEKIKTTMVTLFWYQSARQTFSNRATEKLSLFFNRLMGKPHHNAFVRLTAAVPQGGSVEATSAHLISFTKQMYPELRRFFI